jgi:hypothetical protein
MDRLPLLRDELAFLERILPEIAASPDLWTVSQQIEERIALIHREIQRLASAGM